MLHRRSRATDRVKERSIWVRAPEMGTKASFLGPKIEEQVHLHNLGRDQIPARSHFAPPVVKIISGIAGRIPEPIFDVGKWIIISETVRKHNIPEGRDLSLQFRDPERQQLLPAEVEIRPRQGVLHQGKPDWGLRVRHRAGRPECTLLLDRRQRQLQM